MPHVQAFEVEQQTPGADWCVQLVRRLLGQPGGERQHRELVAANHRLFFLPQTLFTNVEGELGETFFANAFDQALDIHLTEPENK